MSVAYNKPIIKIARNTPDVRIVYKEKKPVSSITRMQDGSYRVTKLYDMEVEDVETYSEARDKALQASSSFVDPVVNEAEKPQKKRGRPRKIKQEESAVENIIQEVMQGKKRKAS